MSGLSTFGTNLKASQAQAAAGGSGPGVPGDGTGTGTGKGTGSGASAPSGSGANDQDVKRMIDHLQGLYSGVMTEVHAFRAELDRCASVCPVPVWVVVHACSACQGDSGSMSDACCRCASLSSRGAGVLIYDGAVQRNCDGVGPWAAWCAWTKW